MLLNFACLIFALSTFRDFFQMANISREIWYARKLGSFNIPWRHSFSILGDPGAASRDDGIFMGESLQQERESPWALTLTERVPEAFEIPPSDWPEKYFSGQSAKRNSRATLMSSYTRLFSSSNAIVAWPVQREHF